MIAGLQWVALLVTFGQRQYASISSYKHGYVPTCQAFIIPWYNVQGPAESDRTF